MALAIGIASWFGARLDISMSRQLQTNKLHLSFFCLSDEVTPPSSANHFKRADSLASAKLAAVIALTSKISSKSHEPIAPVIHPQKSMEETFGESSVTKVKDWWLTLVDDNSEDEF